MKPSVHTDLEKTLLARNITPTAMRMMVLEELGKMKTAVSLNDLEAVFERADKVTLYRTLKTFQKHKLVHSVTDGSGSVKYALCQDTCECSPEEIHAHFHCTKCNETYCLQDYHLPVANLPRQFVLEEMSVVLRGRCDHCS